MALHVSYMIGRDPSQITTHLDSCYTALVPEKHTSWAAQVWVRPVNLIAFATFTVLQTAEFASRTALAIFLAIPYIAVKQLRPSSNFNRIYEENFSFGHLTSHFGKIVRFAIATIYRPLFGSSHLTPLTDYDTKDFLHYQVNTKPPTTEEINAAFGSGFIGMLRKNSDTIVDCFSSYYTANVPLKHTSWAHQLWVRPLNLVVYGSLAGLQAVEFVTRLALSILLFIPARIGAQKTHWSNPGYLKHPKTQQFVDFYNKHFWNKLGDNFGLTISLPIAAIVRCLFGSVTLKPRDPNNAFPHYLVRVEPLQATPAHGSVHTRYYRGLA